VATSIPALRDLLTDEEVQFIEPDNAQAMVEGIKAVLGDKERTKARVEAALEKAKRFSYVRRAETILRRCKL
jgi:glycosyltransferase involved in cell wall biosynthesis